MRKLLPMATLLLQVCVGKGQSLPQMRSDDKVRIKEAITISNRYSDAVWKGMAQVPFIVLFVTDSTEFLINHPYPSADFQVSEDDKILNTKIFYRKRLYSKSFLATFPAVNGVNCIVVGTPENTSKNSTDWIITLLHEHFHQYQYTQNDYYESVKGLDLSGGDETGMWQLNYSFPYDSLPVSNQYLAYANALSKAVKAIDKTNFNEAFKKFSYERQKLTQLLKTADYQYLSFQLWQEGIARYTEYKFLQLLDNYTPSSEVVGLKDFITFKEFKREFLRTHLASITNLKLDKEKRVCIYDIGLAEGMLLDKLNPLWRSMYLTEKFYLEKYR